MRIAMLLALLAHVSCGGSSNSGPTEAPINLTSAGASSAALTIPSGGRVHFFNKDTANHQMASPCGALSSPLLAPGADYLSPTITGPVACAFSDSLNPNNSAFKGTVTVGPPGATGGGSGY